MHSSAKDPVEVVHLVSTIPHRGSEEDLWVVLTFGFFSYSLGLFAE
jgi:hypothetical protein